MENQYEHFGICDASAGIAIDNEHFMVANDEDNSLSMYKATESGDCLKSYDISNMLVLKKLTQEADIEGAARLGDDIYWITSHARNSKGEEKPSRHQFFATKYNSTQQSISQVGKTYTGLLKDLKNKFPEIKEAAEKKEKKGDEEKNVGPEEKGALNIEGLAACSDNKSLILGFRNPVPEGKAFLVKLLNPSELIKDANVTAEFSEPIRVDLGGRGVRAIAYWATKNCYLIVGGSYHDNPVVKGEHNFVLYKWNGEPFHKPESLNIDLGDLNPEAIIIYPNDKVQLLSDDGGRPEDKPCKELFKESKESQVECKKCHFRSLVVNI